MIFLFTVSLMMIPIIDTIKNYLNKNTRMPFVDYMQQALYAPYSGYYSSNTQKLGKYGDFITAPELTPLFGKTLANQCQQILSKFGSANILEFGAGTGQLCIDILCQLDSLQCLPEKYTILEVSGNLRGRQEAHIKKTIPHLASRVQWLDRLPKTPFQGIILVNEVLDAMPVHRFMQTETGLLESHIQLDEQKNLCERFLPCTNVKLIKHLDSLLPPIYPYLSEANLYIDAWIQSCHNILEQGAVFIIDYGFNRQEYYHPDRYQGTLMCHYQHQAHSNPLAHPGEEDITAHVDFTHVAEAAYNAGFSIAGFTNQAAFLLANGILQLLETIPSEKEKIFSTQALKQLLQPQEMGELFKVIALTKEINYPLKGFQLQDKLASL
jgi:SAM-dependent MidA family methyltransferase